MVRGGVAYGSLMAKGIGTFEVQVDIAVHIWAYPQAGPSFVIDDGDNAAEISYQVWAECVGLA